MNFQQGDILVKSNTIWCIEKFVCDNLNISIDYLRKVRTKYKQSVTPCHRYHNILPDTGKSWRWAKINNNIYYALSNIPNRKPTYYREQFGDADSLVENYELCLKNQASNLLEAELSYFVKENYKKWIGYYSECNDLQQNALAKACAVIEFTGDYIARNELRGNKIFKEVCQVIEEKDMRYLPFNYRRFKEKFEDYSSGISLEDIIKLPRSGNSHALIFDDPELEAAALKLRARGENYTNEYIIRKVQELCEIKGRRVPSRRWFGQKVFELNETKFLTDHLRHGFGSRKAFENTGYIPLERALYAGDCWQVDATRMNLIEHQKDSKNDTKKDGKKKKKEKNFGFLYVVAVKDVHSGDILGYAFDFSENRFVYANALKMAVENAGYLPYELVTDRFPGHNTPEMKTLFSTMKTLGTKITVAHKSTGKPHVERGFGTLQTVFMQESKYYYGEGIQSRNTYAHRSPEYLKSIRKEARQEGYDLTASYNESQAIIEAFRTTPLSYYSRKHAKVDRSPQQIHQESEKPNVKEVKAHQISILFGMKKKATIKHDGMIKTEIHKVEYYYHVKDYEVMKKYKQVILSYDLEDLNQVHLFEQTGEMLVHITTAEVFNKPQIYGAQTEFNKVAKEKQRLKAIQDRKASDLEEQLVLANEIDLLMGRFTSKADAENAETARILNDTRYENKRTANSDVISDGSDIDLDDFIHSQL